MAEVPDNDSIEPTSGGYTPLYVGDLEENVKEDQLLDLFKGVGEVVSVRICRDYLTKRSLGYGYVNFSSGQDAIKAMEELNFTPLNEKRIRITRSFRDPSARNIDEANVFIKNLDKSIDHKALFDVFSSFGNILSCKIATDASGESKGHGFVQFETEESAKKAIENLNGMLLNDKQVYVGPFVRKEDRKSVSSEEKFNNIFVKNLSSTITEADLQKIFGEYGVITSAVVMKDVLGQSKGFGFVNFENADDAARARDALDGKTFDGKAWYVGRAQKKSERELQLKEQHDQNKNPEQCTNLYVKNLDDSIGDAELNELFSEYGAITSSKVMRDNNGISKGCGFVAYSNHEEADLALASMNGRIVAGKPLYVNPAEKKEDRRTRLEASFSTIRAAPPPPSLTPQCPMYPIADPGLGPPLFYRQIRPALVSQAGIDYHKSLARGMRRTGPPIPSFFRVVPTPRPWPPVQPLMITQPMLPGINFYRGPRHQNVQNIDLAGLASGEAVALEALVSAVANATPEMQRILLGETLYPLVEKLEPYTASKITGMLLEMDQPEVLHLIESPDDLAATVAEAMDALREVPEEESNTPDDQLASLSLIGDPWS